MLQIKLPVRAYKKLIYLASVSSFLCFLALHLTISYQRDHLPYELSDVNDHNGQQGQVIRGLLQKTPVDYPNVAIPPVVGGSSSSSSSSASASASLLLLTSSPSTNTDNKSQPSRLDPTKSTSLPSSSSLSNQLSTSPNSIAAAASGSSSSNGDGSLISTLPLISTNIIHDHSKFNGYGEDISHYLDAEPQVDNVPVLGESQLLMELENQSKINNNNLALSYWLKARKYPKAKQNNSNSNSKTCRVEFPNLYELEYNNIYWQKFPTINGTFYLYGAYYDNRWRGGVLPMVRILAMIDRVQPPPTLCQIWFDRISVPIISPATYIYGWYSKWGNYKDGFLQPYIVTCKIPRIKGLPKDFYPTSVSLVENRCQKASNNLRIINNRPAQKQEFAVCVKGLDFLHEDLSVRLVEWIELLRLLGANKIFLYDLEVHPNITKVLDYYQQDGLVELTKITLPGHQPNLPGFRHLYLKNKLTHKRQNELIPYNDCLYRNLYSYNYVALLDIDEVIMPLKHSNWSELMKEVQNMSLKEKNYTRASYNVRNVYFLDDLNHDEEQMRHEAHEIGIPRYLHMLQHVYRSQNYTKPGQYVKCFHNTERVVSLHNHFPLNCFGTCTTYSIPVELAHLQHYRKDCVGPLKKSCKEFRQYTTRDTTIFRYKDELVQRTTHVLKTLGFFGPDQPQQPPQQHSNRSSS